MNKAEFTEWKRREFVTWKDAAGVAVFVLALFGYVELSNETKAAAQADALTLWDGTHHENQRIINPDVSEIADDGTLAGWWNPPGEKRIRPVAVWSQNDGVTMADYTHFTITIRADTDGDEGQGVALDHEWRSWTHKPQPVPVTRIEGITTEWKTITLPLPDGLAELHDHSVFSPPDLNFTSTFVRFRFWVSSLTLSAGDSPDLEPEPEPPIEGEGEGEGETPPPVTIQNFAPDQVWLALKNDQGIETTFIKLHTMGLIEVHQRSDGVLTVAVDDAIDFVWAVNMLGSTFKVEHASKRLTLSGWPEPDLWMGTTLQHAEEAGQLGAEAEQQEHERLLR